MILVQLVLKLPDSHTLEVKLKAPTPFFTGLLSHYSTWPVHKETVLKHGSIDDRNGEWTRLQVTLYAMVLLT